MLGVLVDLVMSQEPYRSARRVFWITDNGSSHRGQTSIDRPVPRLSRTPGKKSSPAPLLGEHTDAILDEIGLSMAEINSAKAEKVV